MQGYLDTDYKRERVSREIVQDLVTLSFEGYDFPVPKEYHTYLTQVFGDYMILPPEDKRVQHAVVELNFGKYA